MNAVSAPTKLNRLLCFLGFHAWRYSGVSIYRFRTCQRCPKHQRQNDDASWEDSL